MTRPNVDWDDAYSAPRRRFLPGPVGLRFGGYGLLVLIAAIALYYGLGALWISRIDDDPAFRATDVKPGASRAVATAAALIEREVDRHHWVANDPIFYPGWMLDNMPNFQQGLVYALSRFALELTDQIGRTRGSSEVDKDLDKAAGLLKYPGNVWVFDLSTSLMPTASSEAQYRAARRALLAYNDRLANGTAVFERRADNLLGTIDRIAADIGSGSAIIDQHLRAPRPWLVDTKVDDIFYATKGRLYGYSIILKELGQDFQNVIRDRDIANVWTQMIESLDEAASLEPLVVTNGEPDGTFFPNHLAVQGFYLLRARTQLREISAILQK